jgi:hypothetical protein
VEQQPPPFSPPTFTKKIIIHIYILLYVTTTTAHDDDGAHSFFHIISERVRIYRDGYGVLDGHIDFFCLWYLTTREELDDDILVLHSL